MHEDAVFCPACGAKRDQPIAPAPVRKPGTGLKKWVYMAIAACACLVLMAVSMRFFLKLVAIAATGLFIFSVVVMLLTFRKKRKIVPLALVIAVITSLVTLWIYSLLLGIHFSGALTFAALFFGAILGIGWALITPVHVNNGVVEREGNLWYLAVWGAIFAVNQLAVILTGRPPHIAMILLLLGTGTVLGNSGSLIWKFYQVKNKATNAGIQT